MHRSGRFMSLYELEKPISELPEIGAHLLSFNLPSKPICGGLSTVFFLASRSGLSPSQSGAGLNFSRLGVVAP